MVTLIRCPAVSEPMTTISGVISISKILFVTGGGPAIAPAGGQLRRRTLPSWRSASTVLSRSSAITLPSALSVKTNSILIFTGRPVRFSGGAGGVGADRGAVGDGGVCCDVGRAPSFACASTTVGASSSKAQRSDDGMVSDRMKRECDMTVSYGCELIGLTLRLASSIGGTSTEPSAIVEGSIWLTLIGFTTRAASPTAGGSTETDKEENAPLVLTARGDASVDGGGVSAA